MIPWPKCQKAVCILFQTMTVGKSVLLLWNLKITLEANVSSLIFFEGFSYFFFSSSFPFTFFFLCSVMESQKIFFSPFIFHLLWQCALGDCVTPGNFISVKMDVSQWPWHCKLIFYERFKQTTIRCGVVPLYLTGENSNVKSIQHSF